MQRPGRNPNMWIYREYYIEYIMLSDNSTILDVVTERTTYKLINISLRGEWYSLPHTLSH